MGSTPACDSCLHCSVVGDDALDPSHGQPLSKQNGASFLHCAVVRCPVAVCHCATAPCVRLMAMHDSLRRKCQQLSYQTLHWRFMKWDKYPGESEGEVCHHLEHSRHEHAERGSSGPTAAPAACVVVRSLCWPTVRVHLRMGVHPVRRNGLNRTQVAVIILQGRKCGYCFPASEGAERLMAGQNICPRPLQVLFSTHCPHCGQCCPKL